LDMAMHVNREGGLLTEGASPSLHSSSLHPRGRKRKFTTTQA
jgi:hypothetical protein